MRLTAYILGATITLFALYLSYMILPILKGLFFKPVIYISAILDKIFIDIPYTVHSLLVFIIGSFFFLITLFIIRASVKKLFLRKRKLFF